LSCWETTSSLYTPSRTCRPLCVLHITKRPLKPALLCTLPLPLCPAATYEVIYMTGWAPHPSQQQAAKRGSATVSFEDLVADLGTEGDGGSGGSSGGSSGGVSGGSSGTLPSSAP